MIALPRSPWSHKGDFGRVLIIGGSHKYTGAATLAGVAALRAGCDVVTLMGHERAMNAASSYCPDLITIPLSGELDVHQVKEILDEATHADVVLLGCGLTSASFDAIRELVEGIKVPMVLDAGAIHAMGEEIYKHEEKTIIMTPHSGEFNSLTNDKLSTEPKERERQVKYWSKKLGVTLLVKGHIDFVSNGIRIETNMTGSPYMTVAGTGDVLAGVTASLLAQKMDPVDAAIIAAQKVGRAGELVAEAKGPGLIASDLLQDIV
jgi:ADP-dependent NAD(P)H-hydrate dehydratase / NAD(P)H-hydrate epimerase